MQSSSATSQVDAIERLVGATVASKYRIDRLLGRGGMGAVFQATNTVINKRVALKFLAEDAARDAQAAQRFQREAEAASLVESEHIVQIFDFGSTEDGVPFLVMELLIGRDLRAELKQHTRLQAEHAGRIVLQVLRALMRAHTAGIVHRDLKPDNVFLCERDHGEPLVKIVDFGISKLARKTTLDTLTKRGTILGTAFYMSPEQAQGLEEVDARADLYSVGAILYEMLAGRPPHTAPTYESVLVAICTRDADDIRTHEPEVPATFARLLRKALCRDRTLRYQTASEMAAALEAAMSGQLEVEPASVAPANTRTRGALARRRTMVAALVALLLGFALTALLLSRSRRAEAIAEAAAPASSAMAPMSAAPAAALPPVPALAAPTAIGAAPVPTARASGARPRITASGSQRKRPTETKPPAGVAGELKLNTSGP